jgi:hypothetical protein
MSLNVACCFLLFQSFSSILQLVGQFCVSLQNISPLLEINALFFKLPAVPSSLWILSSSFRGTKSLGQLQLPDSSPQVPRVLDSELWLLYPSRANISPSFFRGLKTVWGFSNGCLKPLVTKKRHHIYIKIAYNHR